MEGYSDLLMAFMRYGGALGMILLVICGVVYVLAWKDDLDNDRYMVSRRRRWKSLRWACVKLGLAFWACFGLFLQSF